LHLHPYFFTGENMTKDEALRLALEALEGADEIDCDMRDAITAIKDALEAKDEPVSQPKVRTGNCLRVGVCASEGHKIQPQRTLVGLTDEEVWEKVDMRDHAEGNLGIGTAQPQRKPLSDEEIDKAWRSVDYTVPYAQFRIDIAKAIEAAHGIKGEA
jgi:hypothetical protein